MKCLSPPQRRHLYSLRGQNRRDVTPALWVASAAIVRCSPSLLSSTLRHSTILHIVSSSFLSLSSPASAPDVALFLRRPHCKHILSSSLQVIKIQHVYSTSFATSSAFSKLLGLPFSKIWWLISGRKPVKNLCKRTLDDLASSRYANLNSFFKSVVKSLTHSCGSWLCIENFRAVASGSTRHQSRSLLE